MIKLYHDLFAMARPITNVERPNAGLLIRKNTDTMILRMNKEQALGLISEIASAFETNNDEINLVIEDIQRATWKQSVFE